ncbi:hypothetical protein F5Y10DRAFT_273420 [Nemania abortiva]|nr:hypothetical protein F5Y10DRAFT_273420 [Nemania abortiva]
MFRLGLAIPSLPTRAFGIQKLQHSHRAYPLPPSQRPLTTAKQSYIEITYFAIATMKLSALVLIALARSFIATAMPLNETSNIAAVNSSSLVLVNATNQTMDLANQSLQPNIEDMDEEKCLDGEEGCVVKNSECRAHNAEECKRCKLACISWLILAPPFQTLVGQDVKKIKSHDV